MEWTWRLTHGLTTLWNLAFDKAVEFVHAQYHGIVGDIEDAQTAELAFDDAEEA